MVPPCGQPPPPANLQVVTFCCHGDNPSLGLQRACHRSVVILREVQTSIVTTGLLCYVSVDARAALYRF